MSQYKKVYAEHLIQRACALYKIGFSYAEIERKIGIPVSILGKIAKERQWLRNPPQDLDVPEIVLEGVIAEEDSTNFKKIAGTEAGQRIVEEAKARTTIVAIEKWKDTAPPAEVSEHDRLVALRIKLEEQFRKSAMRNQKMADRHMELAEKIADETGANSLDLDDIKTHAEITKVNKATVLGGDPLITIDARGNSGATERSIVFMPAALAGDSEAMPAAPVAFDEVEDRARRHKEEDSK